MRDALHTARSAVDSIVGLLFVLLAGGLFAALLVGADPVAVTIAGAVGMVLLVAVKRPD